MAFDSLRLDAVDRAPRPALLDGRRDAADEPAAPDPDDDDVDVREVLDDLEPERPVAGDHVRIVERVGERQAALVADLLEPGERLADVLAVEDDLRAVPDAGVDLRAYGAGRHHDDRRDARLAAGPGVGLPGVPGRQRDDPRPPLLRGQRRDLGRHATRLERARDLEVLGLDEQPIAGQPRAARRPDEASRGRRAEDRRAVDPRRDDLAGREDPFERHDSIGHRRSIADRGPADRDLRACAINDSLERVLETAATTTTELDRQRFAAVGRALADPKRLCVLESLAAGSSPSATCRPGSAARSPT